MKVRLEGLQEAAKTVLARLAGKKDAATIVGLVGELGAGKTTFVQALAKELEITETVQSPTYVLMKKYPIFKKASPFKALVHIDVYRLDNAREFLALKPEQFLQDLSVLVCIEWPERVEGALPASDLVLRFSSDPPAGEAGAAGEGERYIEGI